MWDAGAPVGGLVSRVEGAEITALCDLYKPNLARMRGDRTAAESFRDFRKLLDRDDIDAVIIATPDHWHAIPTVMACAAGKDVYVEKPLGHNIREGEAMLAAARRGTSGIRASGDVVAIGPRQLSQIREIIRSGELGKGALCADLEFTNMYPRGMAERVRGFTPSDADGICFSVRCRWLRMTRSDSSGRIDGF